MPYHHIHLYYLACGDVECSVCTATECGVLELVDLDPVQAALIRTLISLVRTWVTLDSPKADIVEIKMGYFA